RGRLPGESPGDAAGTGGDGVPAGRHRHEHRRARAAVHRPGAAGERVDLSADLVAGRRRETASGGDAGGWEVGRQLRLCPCGAPPLAVSRLPRGEDGKLEPCHTKSAPAPHAAPISRRWSSLAMFSPVRMTHTGPSSCSAWALTKARVIALDG